MRVDWSECRNARDLGGLAAAGGRRTRSGALVRSDSHEGLSAGTVRAVRAGAVSRVVDLRWGWECDDRPSPFAADAFYRHVPMLADVLPYEPPPDTYAPMLDHHRERIGEAFRTVAEAPPGAVVVHCQAGKDRTGVLVALLLGVAGVAAADIAGDYARTDGCSPPTMLATLDHLESRYRGVASYLKGSGVGDETILAARSRLLD